ncbi:PREDICTED: mediator of RNA polymerase II transcription subunit 21 [Nicrophorus vespilloides]|uniref:Mediator of RNA polymerase II transcription subunit 21 n=1 Tax=Nicrophorus vespilloides TaxID=110193 RepID=A0ABM1M2W1_NICVS|nr:PREDICTED: mediator of RNA polymerase II transcription subunit 21 [Nicrophorus vespilloides]
MADRLTQLQDCINQQADNFCNSIGILQQFASPSKFSGFDRSGSQTPQQQSQEDYVQLFTTLIARCSKDIDTLIESLPSEENSTELQLQSLRTLETENQEAAERLEVVVKRGQDLLEKIQAALSDIAQAQLDMQHMSKSGASGKEPTM